MMASKLDDEDSTFLSSRHHFICKDTNYLTQLSIFLKSRGSRHHYHKKKDCLKKKKKKEDEDDALHCDIYISKINYILALLRKKVASYFGSTFQTTIE